MEHEKWTKSEKAIARRAFKQAYERECEAIADEARRLAEGIVGPEDMWQLHDFLTQQRGETDEKYDYRYSVLVFVFARLIGEGWLKEDEIAGLGEDKLRKIRLMVQMMNE